MYRAAWPRSLDDPLEHVRQKVLDVLVGDRDHHCWHTTLDQEAWEFQAHVKYESITQAAPARSEIRQSGSRVSRSWYVVTGVAGRLAQPQILSC